LRYLLISVAVIDHFALLTSSWHQSQMMRSAST
jgi:hypothetical protein